MRVAVSGRDGQILRALQAKAMTAGVELVTFGRPGVDLTKPDCVAPAIAALKPAIVVSAAAYTAVDLAESHGDLARSINVVGAGAVARAAAQIGVPVIHLSTDYVFDGTCDRPYREDDAALPISVYGRSKLDGEAAVAAANLDCAILRTSWVYSPYGRNFVRTMLALARERDEVRVVKDQIGAPTNAFDLADGIFKVAQNLVAQPQASDLRGIFHLTNGGVTNWAEIAARVFERSAQMKGPSARVVPILARDYPTAAQRPANSRLDNAKIARLHGVTMPPWDASLDDFMQLYGAEASRPHAD